jgi:hypothetical protein
MSVFVATSLAPQIDISLLRRDYFDGVSFLLQDADGVPYDLTDVQICSAVWKRTGSNTADLVTSFNVEEQEPLRNGIVKLWLSSTQTALIWDAAAGAGPSNISQAFFPSAYTIENSSDSLAASALSWDLRIEKKEQIADLVSISAGTFVSQTNHGLGATERVIFENTAQSSINYNGTSARIYTNLTGITYAPPYSFTIASLSGVTNAAPGGSVYRLKQDTVVAGSVFVGTTFSNCFP